MPTIYKRNCDYCGRYYEGRGVMFCSSKCGAKTGVFNSGRFLKGNKLTKETREKMSESRMGHPAYFRVFGKDNPNFRHGFSNTKEYKRAYQSTEKYKEWKRKYYRERLTQNPKYCLNNNIRCGIWRSLKGIKSNHWEDLVGYTLDNLMKHLDFSNNKEKDIDHKIPISWWNFTKATDPEFKLCWAMDNLQMLPAFENGSKKDKASIQGLIKYVIQILQIK